MIVEPSVGTVLVELAASNFGAVSTVEKKFDSITSGTIIAVNDADKDKYGIWIGRTGHWEEYKDSCRLKLSTGEKGALIQIKDVAGTSYNTKTMDAHTAQNKGLVNTGGTISPGFIVEVENKEK